MENKPCLLGFLMPSPRKYPPDKNKWGWLCNKHPFASRLILVTACYDQFTFGENYGVDHVDCPTNKIGRQASRFWRLTLSAANVRLPPLIAVMFGLVLAKRKQCKWPRHYRTIQFNQIILWFIPLTEVPVKFCF